jgi:hypothetical protein
LIATRWFSVNAAALAAAFAFALTPSCDGCDGGGSDDGDVVDGLGDPCTSDGTVNDLCLPGFVCVEASAGSGGSCATTPLSCDVDVDDASDAFCACDLDELCENGAVPSCYVLEGRRGVICAP